jgi:phosphate transport system substrate-binding protein
MLRRPPSLSAHSTRIWILLLVPWLVVACNRQATPLPAGGAQPPGSGAGSPVAAQSPVAPAAGGSNVAACPPSGSATQLTGAGATFPGPIYSRWFSDYKSQCNVEINYQAIGSGGGISQHTQKTVNFGASDGIMTDAQKQAAPGTLHIPTVAGAVAVVVNLPGVQRGQVKLTPDTLAAIYLGQITKWNDPRLMADNQGVPLSDVDIIVVRRADGSGTTNIFTSYLAKVSNAWRDQVGAGNSVNWPVGLGGEGNAGVAGQVRQLPGGIGYVELAYAKQNNMVWASLRNQANRFVEPTLEATTAAMEGVQIPESTEVMIVDSANQNAYPIAGFTWLLVYQEQSDAAVGRTLAQVIWWATHDGQRTAAELDYAPLSPGAQRAAEGQIRKIRAGGQAVIP